MPIDIKWKTGSRLSADPKEAYQVLEKVRAKNNGDIPLAEVVRASKPKRAPLHGEFEWDDTVAGEKYRLEQARYIVRSIEVVREELPQVQSRAFEAVLVASATEGEKTKSVFRSTEDILADPIARADLIGSFIKDIMALRRRYAALSELALVWDSVDKTVRNIEATKVAGV